MTADVASHLSSCSEFASSVLASRGLSSTIANLTEITDEKNMRKAPQQVRSQYGDANAG